MAFAEEQSKNRGASIPPESDQAGYASADSEASRRLEDLNVLQILERVCGQVEGSDPRRPSRARAFRTQSAVAEIPIRANKPLDGSGTAATPAPSA
jgi:hypothetical protein